jgi:hypothetical protein
LIAIRHNSQVRRWIAGGFLAALVLLPIAGADSTFEFQSGFWINLHHFLYEQASMDTPPAATPPAWQNALSYYRSEVMKLDLLTEEAEHQQPAFESGRQILAPRLWIAARSDSRRPLLPRALVAPA